MADAVSSDGVESVRATLVRAGRTDRPKVTLPADARDRVAEDEVVRLSLGRTTRHARIERALDDGLEIRGAYDTPRAARERDGPNRLVEWVEDVGLGFDRTVHLDVVEEGFFYGLRAPGERAVYHVPDRPDEGLAGIAEEIEGVEEERG
jgi:hypothetical protein